MNPPIGDEQQLEIPATDGFRLAASLTLPEGGDSDPDRMVLIAPATGVPRSFYQRFADFLSGQGLGVVSWDWRGIGGSAPDSLRGFEATMRDWGEKDLQGVLEWTNERFPDAVLTAVGHSYGGQGIGLAPTARRLRGLVTVATQSGYWGHWPSPEKYRFALLWYVLMPGLTRLLGYFPSSLLGLGEDLPPGVALEWARWCRSPEYLGDYDGHARLEMPILSLSFTDDTYGPREGVEWMHERFTAAEVEMRHLTPDEVGAERVGHLGFFRDGVVPGLWEEVADWLRRV